jgi:hypothetical protein
MAETTIKHCKHFDPQSQEYLDSCPVDHGIRMQPYDAEQALLCLGKMCSKYED